MAELPLPSLALRELGGIPLLTDDALARTAGVRVAFTGRAGGVSAGAYAALNLGSHVGDDLAAVEENRRVLMAALGLEGSALLVPSQVHGTDLVSVSSSDPAALSRARTKAMEGADGLVVAVPNVAALLCFADCAPVVLVAPDGRFAVAHAGWRGCVAGIAAKAARVLAADAGVPASCLNAYVGPHIGPCCFEVGDDVAARFAAAFGAGCVSEDGVHVSLARALAADLAAAGVDPARVCEAGVCTRCHPDEYFSYRASGGVCGRHGALACRLEG